jgi:multicomponent Na+:H+ antiporter subunit B
VSRRIRVAAFVPALVVLFALLLWGFAGMPDFGHYRGPYGFVLERIATPERHVTNVVNATTYDYRGFDTMGVEFILFAAVTGVVLLLRGSSGSRRRADDDVRSDSIRLGGAVAPALVILVGLWLVAFGFVTPGGGFQGGVAVAAGALMLFVAVGYRAWSTLGDERLLDPIEGLGAGGYAIVGLAALVSGVPFLTNLFGPGVVGTVRSGGSAALLNWAAAIEVAAANVILTTEFVEQYIAPMVRRRG